MLKKIDIRPIFKGHIDTLRDRQGRLVVADIVGFYAIPAGISLYLTFAGFQVIEKYINTAIIAQSILIPLLLNVVMMIYGLIDRVEARKARRDHEKEEDLIKVDDKCLRLLRQLYDTLAYTIIMSAICLISLAIYTVERFPSVVSGTNRLVLYFLVMHIFLLAMMIMKRLHKLLVKEFDGD